MKKENDSFKEYENHLRGNCIRTKCFYCKQEETIIEDRYKYLKKVRDYEYTD